MKLEQIVTTAGPNGRAELPQTVTSATVARYAEREWRPWYSKNSWGMFLMVAYPLLIIAPLGILTFLQPQSDRPRIAELGVACATVGLTIIAMQFLIAARFRWIEAPFGLDVLLAFHRAMALLAAALLCAHPLLVAAGNEWSLLTRLNVHWYIWAGRLTLAALLTHVIISLWRRSLRLSYESWRRLHTVFAVSILTLAFSHAFTVGGEQPGARAVWSVVFTIAMSCWLYTRTVRPHLLVRTGFRVVEVRPEAPRVWTVEMEQRQNRPLRFVPGQFQFLRFPDSEVSAQEHPFTIASSPTGRRINITIKESGDFTARIRHVKPGDLASVHGPFGRFSHTLHRSDEQLVFVAGGVGITPLMSMLRWMRDNGDSRSVLLLYANRRPDDVLFAQELAEMQTNSAGRLMVVHVLSDPPPQWHGETGRLDADRIIQLCGGIEGKSFYLCCPSPMTAALVRGLRRLGVRPRHIHTDHFAL
jgi:predicted ferric reductase